MERLNLLTLEERRNRADLVELFKISKGLSAIPWNSFRVDSSERIIKGPLKETGEGEL